MQAIGNAIDQTCFSQTKGELRVSIDSLLSQSKKLFAARGAVVKSAAVLFLLGLFCLEAVDKSLAEFWIVSVRNTQGQVVANGTPAITVTVK